MTAWIKDNTIQLSLVLFITMLAGIITITLSYADKESEQNEMILKNQQLSLQNDKNLCKLAELVERHIEKADESMLNMVNRANQNLIKNTAIQSDVEHIKGDIQEIKALLRAREVSK